MTSSSPVGLDEIIRIYDLKPHMEGGFAQLLYEDPQIIEQASLPGSLNGARSFWNAIYYLLPKDSRCILHRIKMSELWNFYLGGPLELFDISPLGKLRKMILGHNVTQGQQLAYVFPPGHWIGAKPQAGHEFSFVSCVTCPGFTFADWEKGDRGKLSNEFAHLKEIITTLTD